MSESQERMCAIVTPANLDAFLALCAKWEVEAVVIGEVTDSGRLTVDWHGERIVDVPPRTVAHEGPVYDRPFHRPVWQDALQADGPEGLARPQTADELRATLRVDRLPIVATGGYAALMARQIPQIEAVAPDLTLEGLRLVWNAHAAEAPAKLLPQ